MKTIIAPVDFSSSSEKACYFAIELAKDLKAKIILHHSFDSTVLYSKLPLMTVQMDYSYLYNSAANKLKTFYKKISKHAGDVEIELNIQPGLPSSRIAELAIEKKADLIVMGTTGKGVVERALIGSNTTRIIGNAPCMVLAVPPKAIYNGFKKIVYATDLTTDNLKYAQRLIPLGKKFNSELIFLNVGKDVADENNVALKKIKTKIKNVVDYSKTSGFIAGDDDVVRGIDYFLKYQKADCLAIYTHHRNLFMRLFDKSIAKSLAVHTSTPLLILHENDLLETEQVQEKNEVLVH